MHLPLNTTTNTQQKITKGDKVLSDLDRLSEQINLKRITSQRRRSHRATPTYYINQWHFKGVKQSVGSFPSNLCWRDVSDHGNKPQNTCFGQILFEIVTHYAVLEGSYLCRQFLVLKRSHVFSCTYTHLCDRDDLYSALKLPSLSTSFSFILFPLVFFLISPDICRNTASDLVAALMKKENWCVCVSWEENLESLSTW